MGLLKTIIPYSSLVKRFIYLAICDGQAGSRWGGGVGGDLKPRPAHVCR